MTAILCLSLVVINDVITETNVAGVQGIQDQTERNVTTTTSGVILPSIDSKMIPFYLYPPSDFPMFWGPNSTCQHEQIANMKHDHAAFAWQAMMQHPWRTSNPLEAELAIVPLSLDLWEEDGCGKMGYGVRKKQMQKVNKNLEKVLKASPIFPSKRHLIIANHWLSARQATSLMKQALHPAGIYAGMEGRGNCKTSLGYTSNYANEFLGLRNPNSALIPNPRRFGMERVHSVHMVAQFDSRPAYNDRVVLFNSTGYIPAPFIASEHGRAGEYNDVLRRCNTAVIGYNADAVMTSRGDFDRCLLDKIDRTMAQRAQEASNFTLCLRGDTLGSDRWIQGMTAGTALIQVADDVDEALDWLPFPHAVPWKDIVITIPRKDYLKDPAKSIRHVLESTSEERLLELQQLSLYHAADLDWTAHHPRVLENLLHEAVHVSCSVHDKYVREHST